MLECFQTHSNAFKRVPTRSNAFIRVQTCLNAFKRVQTCSNVFKRVQTCLSRFKLVQTCLNTFKCIWMCPDRKMRRPNGHIIPISQDISFEKNSLFKVCLFWPSFSCLIHFTLWTCYSNQPRYLLWHKFFVHSLSILTKLLLLDSLYIKDLIFQSAKISPLK